MSSLLLPAAGCFLLLTIGVGVTLSGLFAVNAHTSLERYLAVQSDSLVGALRISRNGKPSLINDGVTDPRFLQPASGWYWQIETADYLLRSRSMWDKSFTADKFTPISAEERRDLLIVTRSVNLERPPNHRVRFTLSANLNETESSIDRFRRILLLCMAAMAVGLFGALYWRVRVAFVPLHRLRSETAMVKSGKKRRIEGKFPQEVAPLAQEINLLLRHNEKTLQTVRRNVGNLAHALKTPLTVILNSLQSGDNVVQQAERMRDIINRYLSRAAGSGDDDDRPIAASSSPNEAVKKLAAVLAKIYPHIQFNINSGKAVRVRCENEDLQEIIGNLMENACKWASSAVFVSVRASGSATGSATSGVKGGGKVSIIVEDDGKGIPKSQLKQVLRRGKRLDETTAGSGIGLAIVEDAVTLAGGKLRLDTSAKGGLKASVQLAAVA